MKNLLKFTPLVIHVLSLTALGFLSGCYEFPEETTVGKGTFGMLVDGKKWIADGGVNIMPPLIKDVYFHYYQEKGLLKISAYRSSSRERINLYVEGVESEGVYKFSEIWNSKSSSCIDSTCFFNIDDKCLLAYKLKDSNSSELIITKFDTTEWIVSGTFEVELENGKGEKVEIERGRFDIQN
ncbi:hypothetical protein R9C00_14575 [Flammeovirgaceae bacterium SG7u.111]|nr:hypothetical protein [Flammeovirgaceae bacterium SG7u.132]WPO38683.1 hypothetical protein R9C00_14575 [Flammeovirgaceae bacterium SG7u.111]